MSAPDFIEPVIGYRAWRVAHDARLRAWTAATNWSPGVNRARCHAARLGVGRRRRHAAPDPDCMCGLYALNDFRDARLAAGDVRGAIAAWGSVEVHRTGFRAEFACVVALAVDEAADPARQWLGEVVARRYGVPLVAAHELHAAARAHGSPLSFDELPDSRSPASDCVSPAGRREGLGRMVEHHLWVREEGDELLIGLGGALASELSKGELLAPRVRQRLRPGAEMAAVLSASGPLILPAPVTGEIVAVNEDLGGRGDRESEEQAWLLRLAPSRWPEEARDLSWGRRGEQLYGAMLATRSSVDVFEELRPELRRAARTVRSFADVREALDAARMTPRFADAHAFEAKVLGVLGPRLKEDSALRGHLARANATMALRVRDLGVDVWFDLRPPGASVEIRAGTGEPDVLIELRAALAADYLLGRADLAGALRRGEASLRGEREHALVLLSVISELVRPSQGSGHRRLLLPLAV